MEILVTGVAGFIGSHVAHALLDRGDVVVGIDNLNDYYDVRLKEARLDRLLARDNFTFRRLDIADSDAILALVTDHPAIAGVVHLAGQAGVRYSLINPLSYVRSNVAGHVVLLEACRHLEGLRHFVYASSSSVYGGNRKMPYSIQDPTDSPISLYGATKKAMEVASHAYAVTYKLPMTGLRFFSVYGPWGRPDMAAYIFTRKILAGEPLPLFNRGDMRRDFTFIDDITKGVIACLDRPPVVSDETVSHRLYNLGNHRAEPLGLFVEILERCLGRKALIEWLPMQPGDVKETFADITESERDLGFSPQVSIEEGLPAFVDWYRSYTEAGGR